MIRKAVILVLVLALFLAASWNFVKEAVLYDPLEAVFLKKSKIRESGIARTAYTKAWDGVIQEKNLFSPLRTYKEPKPVSLTPPPPPPKKPELSLKGIVLDTFGEYVAYVEINQARAAALRKGDKAEDIEVTDISDKKVVLQWMNETITLTIEKVKTLSGKPRAGK